MHSYGKASTNCNFGSVISLSSALDSVQLTLTFNNTPLQVWETWTNPFMLAQWFGSDPAGTVTSAIVDLKVGGDYSISFHDRDGTEHTCLGVYTTVVPYEALSFSWAWKNEPGQVTKVDISINIQEKRKVTMSFTHSNLGTHSAHQYQEGWDRTFQKLKHLLSKYS
ncbi:MAG: SRPBCC domain-containing protein [Cyclobacteriaceae bacterium]